MLSFRRLRQLQELAVSHPVYFLHNYRKELTNAGYEEIVAPVAKPTRQAAEPSGRKGIGGASLIKKRSPNPGQAPSEAPSEESTRQATLAHLDSLIAITNDGS